MRVAHIHTKLDGSTSDYCYGGTGGGFDGLGAQKAAGLRVTEHDLKTRKASRRRGSEILADAASINRRTERDPMLDPRGRTPAWSMRTVYRLYDMWCQPILEREKISASHWIVLRILSEQGAINQLELGQRAGIPATTMVNALDGLELRRLIKRERDPSDRRKYYVSITNAGRALLMRLLPKMHDAAHQSMADIPADDVANFWKVLLKIEENLSSMLNLEVLLD